MAIVVFWAIGLRQAFQRVFGWRPNGSPSS